MPSQDEYYNFYNQYVKNLVRSGDQAQGYCPFHADEGTSHKGFSVNLDTGRWFCFSGCGEGNSYVFCDMMKIPRQYSPDHQESSGITEVIGSLYGQKFKQLYLNDMSKVVKYLKSRNIGVEFIKQLVKNQMIAYEQDRHGAEWCVFPIRSSDNHIMGFNKRWIGGTPFKSKNKNEGSSKEGFWGMNKADRLVVTEGCITAMTLMQYGIPAAAVISCTNQIDPKTFKDVKEIIIGFDRGEEVNAGKAALNLGYVRVVQWPTLFAHNYDFNDLLVEVGPKEFKDRVMRMVARANPLSTIALASDLWGEFDHMMHVRKEQRLLGCTTGFEEWDRKTLGLIGVAVLGAQRKSGKSTLVMNIMLNHLRMGKPIYYVDFEMGFNDTMKRMLSAITGLHTSNVGRYWGDNQLEEASAELRRLSQLLVIEPRPRGMTFDRVKSNIRALERRVGRKVELVIWDSLQRSPFIKVGMKTLTDQRQVIEEWMNFFEASKNDLGVSFLVVSELTREKEQYKESGRIEYAADQALKLKAVQESSMHYADLYLEYGRHTKRGPIARYILKPDRIMMATDPTDYEFSSQIEEQSITE